MGAGPGDHADLEASIHHHGPLGLTTGAQGQGRDRRPVTERREPGPACMAPGRWEGRGVWNT